MANFHAAALLPKVIQYIERQAEHHPGRTFGNEFRSLLERYDVSYDEAYLFDEEEPETVREAGDEFMGRS